MKLVFSFFIVLALSTFTFAEKRVRPIINVSPLFIQAEYGMYGGVSLSGGALLDEHHVFIGTADIAPWGGLSMSEAATEGKESHFGGTLGYQYKFRIANDFFKVAPGAVVGVSTVPYVYGTWPMPSTSYPGDPLPVTSSEPESKPERETLFGAGPDLAIELGRKSLNFFIRGRVLFARDHNTAGLFNMGVSYTF